MRSHAVVLVLLLASLLLGVLAACSKRPHVPAAPIAVRSHAVVLVLLWASLLLGVFAACSGRPKRPHVPPAAPITVPLAGSVRGVGGDSVETFAAVAIRVGESAGTKVEARRGTKRLWESNFVGDPGPLALTTELVAVAISGRAIGPTPRDDARAARHTATTQLPADRESGSTAATRTRDDLKGGSTAATQLRGDPGAAVVAIDRAKSGVRWQLAFDSNEWSLISSMAPLGTDLIVGGSFGGTLRVGASTVTSAGGSDGFVARITANGQLAWLIRIGGAGADGVQGVAGRRDRIAIAGTFTAGADLLGHPMTSYDEKSPFGDIFVAELDAKGARRWVASLGGKADDTVAGVTIDELGNTVVAASVREVVHVGSAHLVSQGDGDGLVVWLGEGGEKGAAVLIGGLDFDGLRAITAVGDKVVVGGFFSGQMKLGDRTLTAGGGDDAFLAALDTNGTVATGWHVSGPGREEIAALSSVPGGFIAGVAHTASATIDSDAIPAPKDPMAGGAVVVRGF